MKRYSERMIYGDGCSEFDDGEYVLFTDAQADKHAALKELQERNAALLKALEPFSTACHFARLQAEKACLGVMDANDYFMWQANRKLCAANFLDAKIVFEDQKALTEPQL